MDKCHSAAWESCSLTDESITLLWCNPPYDDDRHGDEKRLELAFLKSTTPKLVRGGVLAFVIPQRFLRHMARRDQRYLLLWLQWALSRPNSASRDEVVAANHASVPVNVLEALAREMLENAATEEPLETQIAHTLLEAARLAQSVAARREKVTLLKVPLMPHETVVDRFGPGFWPTALLRSPGRRSRLADGWFSGLTAVQVDPRNSRGVLGLVHPLLTGCDYLWWVVYFEGVINEISLTLLLNGFINLDSQLDHLFSPCMEWILMINLTVLVGAWLYLRRSARLVLKPAS